MRTPMNRAARTYLRRVSRLMCCSGEEKRSRLQGLRESILEASAAGQPFETPDQVAAHFGAPEAMAEELLESLPLEEELFRQTRRLALLRTVVACLAVILICSGLAFLFWLTYDSPVIDLSDLSFYTKGI